MLSRNIYECKEYEPPSLEKDGVVLKFISGDKERYSPHNFCTRSESSLITWLARGSFQVKSEIDTSFTPENKCW
jgi:hypothetical protein